MCDRKANCAARVGRARTVVRRPTVIIREPGDRNSECCHRGIAANDHKSVTSEACNACATALTLYALSPRQRANAIPICRNRGLPQRADRTRRRLLAHRSFSSTSAFFRDRSQGWSRFRVGDSATRTKARSLEQRKSLEREVCSVVERNELVARRRDKLGIGGETTGLY